MMGEGKREDRARFLLGTVGQTVVCPWTGNIEGRSDFRLREKNDYLVLNITSQRKRSGVLMKRSYAFRRNVKKRVKDF